MSINAAAHSTVFKGNFIAYFLGAAYDNQHLLRLTAHNFNGAVSFRN